MSAGERWHRQDWHRLTIAEKREEQRRRHDEQFIVREYRCRKCVTVVDGPTRIGHLRRCQGELVASRAASLAQASSEALDAYFTVVADKGAGWRIDAAVPGGVQQAAGGSMESGANGVSEAKHETDPADKRAWAASWASQQQAPTAVGLIAAVREHFGTGVSNRVAAAILRDVRKPASKPRISAGSRPIEPPRHENATPINIGEAAPSAYVIGAVLDMLERLRSLGVESFKMGGREFAVR